MDIHAAVFITGPGFGFFTPGLSSSLEDLFFSPFFAANVGDGTTVARIKAFANAKVDGINIA